VGINFSFLLGRRGSLSAPVAASGDG
jgi:hypothetical protein